MTDIHRFDPVLKDLEHIGIKFGDVNDLRRHLSSKHKRAIPIILEHIRKLPEDDKEALVRALTKKGFDEAVPFLLEEFRRTPLVNYKWVIGNAFDVIQPKKKEWIEEMKKFVQDRSHGIGRQMMVSALGKIKEESAIPILIRLLDDSDVSGHALDALSRLKRPELDEQFERFVNHKVTWIKNTAKQAIRRTKNRRPS